MRLKHYGLHMLAVSIAAMACSARGGTTTIIPNEDTGVQDTPITPPEDRPVVSNDNGSSGCALPQQMCGGVCVDVTISPVNCGSCGNRCASGQTCTGGSCVTSSTCNAPRMMCSGVCVDVSADGTNCGSCGNRCSAGQSCSGGVCTGGGSCAAPNTMCDVCTNIQSDNNNCGLCGFRCPTGESCSLGACHTGSSGCTAPRSMCGTVCTDTSTDITNCGTCGLRCATGQSCSGGRCGSTSSTSPAGGPCTATGTECGAVLECSPSGRSGFCTGDCTDGTATSERSQCGGTGSTCLTRGEGATATSLCTHACDPAASVGSSLGCRSGQVCTGWWYTRTTAGDTPGCIPFCASSADCVSPTPVCNTRTGSCAATSTSSSLLADGSACNPTITSTPPGETTPRNTQCRGLCFAVSSTAPTRGLCGSFLNVGVSTSCPDNPSFVLPRAPSGEDNLALCLFRGCTRNSECGTGLICIYPEASGVPQTTADRLCQYATAAQPSGAP